MTIDANILLLTLSRERPALERFLTNRLGCSAAAEDVLQTLSERLVRDPIERDMPNAKAYVFRAAANAAIDHARALTTRTAYESENAQLDPIDPLHPERVALGVEALREVENALREVPALSKRMFLLYRVDGVAQKDIAETFRVSLSTVEKRIAKVTAHCHARLTEKGFTGPTRRSRSINGSGKDRRR